MDLKYGMRMDWIHLAQGLVVDSCENGNETSSFIKGRKFLEHLRGYTFLKGDSVPLNKVP
jgi:hypothetical protein